MKLWLERSGRAQLGEFTAVLLSLLFQLVSKLLPLSLTLLPPSAKSRRRLSTSTSRVSTAWRRVASCGVGPSAAAAETVAAAVAAESWGRESDRAQADCRGAGAAGTGLRVGHAQRGQQLQ